MIVTRQPFMSTTKQEEGIVDVDGTPNQAVMQRFSRTLPGVGLNFQGLGLYLKTGPSFVG